MAGLKLVSLEEHIAKIKAAIAARKDKNFLIIARTDSRAVFGIEEAIRRGKAATDLIYVEMLESVDELKKVVKNIKAPLMYDTLENSKVPYMNAKDLEKIGYKLVIYPRSSTFLYARTSMKLMTELKKTGTTAGFLKDMMTRHDYEALLGLGEIKERENILTSECKY